MMDEQKDTRIFWEGHEVHFICWRNEGLVFNWDDPCETAMNMPRGTVRRLMKKGVLEIEGYSPEWTQYAEDAPPAAKEQKAQAAAGSQLSTDQKKQKVGILARLIRKLGAEPTPSVQPLETR